MKIECDELLVICDNCGHAIHVKELDKNSIELNRKNDELVSKQEVIETTKRVYEWRATNNIEDFKDLLLEYFKNLVPAQPTFEPLSMEEFVGEISPTTPDTIVKWLDLARHIYGMGYVICRK